MRASLWLHSAQWPFLGARGPSGIVPLPLALGNQGGLQEMGRSAYRQDQDCRGPESHL